MEVLSVHTTSSLPAPISGASWLPRRWGKSNQLAVFHDWMRSVPHSRQRIAVEVDHACGQAEMVTQRRQRVLRVEGAAVLEGGGHVG